MCKLWNEHSYFIGVIFLFVAEGQVPRVPIFVRKTQFRLPFKSVTPVIMIGPGTGLAPFRGFIQDRHSQKQSGQYFVIVQRNLLDT